MAALLVVATHAAYGTGKESHGYVGLLYTRLEIGVPIFFVLSGFLLFAPWVRSAAAGCPPPILRRYAWRRARRVMPAYVITVLAAFLVCQFRADGPDPGQTWIGLCRYLTLTQIYTGNYLLTYAHQGLTQMWSLAVEVAFYAALPGLSYLLLVTLCRRRWKPLALLGGLAALTAVSPAWLIVLHTTDWLPTAAGMWLPANLAWFACGMALAVLQATGTRCFAFVAVPLALVSYLIVSTPIAGGAGMAPVTAWQPVAKTMFYALTATLLVAPLALGDHGWYARLLGSRALVWLGEISYEIFLVHVLVMAIVTGALLRWPVFTGSLSQLLAVTLAMTVPLAWALQRTTRSEAQRPTRPPQAP